MAGVQKAPSLISRPRIIDAKVLRPQIIDASWSWDNWQQRQDLYVFWSGQRDFKGSNPLNIFRRKYRRTVRCICKKKGSAKSHQILEFSSSCVFWLHMGWDWVWKEVKMCFTQTENSQMRFSQTQYTVPQEAYNSCGYIKDYVIISSRASFPDSRNKHSWCHLQCLQRWNSYLCAESLIHTQIIAFDQCVTSYS